MAFSTWLKRIFGSQDNEQNDVKTRTQTIGELQKSPHTAWGNQGIIKGVRFSATLQLRTPLRVLKHHHEFFDGSGPPPPLCGRNLGRYLDTRHKVMERTKR